MTQRTERIDELLRQEIGQLIAREIADPDVGFATVTDVETTPDLRHARVWVSVIGSPEARRASVQALQRAMPFVRGQLGRRLRLKRIPEFSVRLDESVERGSRILQVLHDLEQGESPDALGEGESLPTPTRGSPTAEAGAAGADGGATDEGAQRPRRSTFRKGAAHPGRGVRRAPR
jgi:ribosome-binding factor A